MVHANREIQRDFMERHDMKKARNLRALKDI